MPNWVENTVTIKSDDRTQLSNILNDIRTVNDEGIEVWNIATKLMPMPEELSVVFGTGDDTKYIVDVKTNEKISISLDEWFEGKDKTDDERGWYVQEITGKEREALREKYGASDWYAWNNRNYGTKWGDCDTRLVKNETNQITFAYDSAWAPAIPISAEISEKYRVFVEHKFFSIENMDEGMYSFENGRTVESWWKELSYDMFEEIDDKKE